MMSAMFDRHVVLIVDDQPDNLAMLSDALDDSGHIVLVATDGDGALARLDYVTPDLILLDAMMPGLDGFETCRRIKLIKSVSHVPVVFMTGLVETEHVVRGFEVGGIDYVTKPIKPQEVVARIGAHIKTSRMVEQARGMLDHVAHAVIVLGANGMPLWQTSKAALLLAKYFPASNEGGKLPATVLAWLNDSLARRRRSGDGAGVIATPLVMKGHGRELQIALADAGKGHEVTLLLEENIVTSSLSEVGASPAGVSVLHDYHLTPRESDVLAWLGKGKTNRDIAQILGMSPRTVNKHLEHIFVKLGVETRSAAAVVASTLYGMQPRGGDLLQ